MATTFQNITEKAFDAKKNFQDIAEEYKHDVEKKFKVIQADVKKFSYSQAQLVLSALKTQKWIKDSKAFQTIESNVPFKVSAQKFEEFKKKQLLKDLAEGILQRAKEIRQTLINDPIGSVKNIREVVMGKNFAKKSTPAKSKAKSAIKNTSKKATKVVKKVKKKKS